MYKRRLKNRPFKTSGPLQKMIDNAVEERMTALKKEGEEPVWSEYAEVAREKLDDGRTKITERRTGQVPGEKDDYDGSGGYMPDDAWNEFLASPEGIEYQKKYGPKELEEERVRFLEEVKMMDAKPVEPIATPERPAMETVKRQEGSMNLAQLLNQNPEQTMTSNASDFFNTEFSSDNPTFDVIKDDKFMRKARKEYNKMDYSGRQRQTMPFNRWLMESYKPKGMDGTLITQARQWEGDNATDTDSSGEGGAVDRDIASARESSEARYKAGPRDWRDTQRQTGAGDRPATRMLKNRTLSFRSNNNNNKPAGFKMKRYGKQKM